jgi:hypothetical protein
MTVPEDNVDVVVDVAAGRFVAAAVDEPTVGAVREDVGFGMPNCVPPLPWPLRCCGCPLLALVVPCLVRIFSVKC